MNLISSLYLDYPARQVERSKGRRVSDASFYVCSVEPSDEQPPTGFEPMPHTPSVNRVTALPIET